MSRSQFPIRLDSLFSISVQQCSVQTKEEIELSLRCDATVTLIIFAEIGFVLAILLVVSPHPLLHWSVIDEGKEREN